MKSRAELFLEHLDGIYGVEPEFRMFDSYLDDAPRVTSILYRDIPEPGWVTGHTFGLSEVLHPEWRHGRPELSITVRSTDIAWALVAAEVANRLRGKCPFCYGDTINFGEPVSPESEMSAFFVFAPLILDRKQYLDVNVGCEQHPIHIAGLYPIYAEERDVIHAIGLEAFWKHPGFDPVDVNRKRIGLPS